MFFVPEGGVSLLRLALASGATLGYGLTDAVFFTFILQVLMKAGATRLLAFLSISLGGAASIIGAPLAAALSVSINHRSFYTYLLLLIAALSCLGISVIFSSYAVPDPAQKPVWRIWGGIGLAALYRASVQSSPIVPTVMDAARVKATDDDFPRRRDLSLSFFYLAYRVGFVAGSIVIAELPDRSLDRLSPIMLIVSLTSLVLWAVAAAAMPREPPPLEDSEGAPPPELPSLHIRFADHLRAALFKADRRLLACYLEIFFYGLAFGQLAAVTASFFNDDLFKNAPGAAEGLRWAAYTALIGLGVSLLFDALLPITVFRANAKKLSMPVAWVGGAILGSALFVAVIFVRRQVTALVLFSLLSITTSTHGLFSLLAAGSYVEPKYRATSFGIRSASMSSGILVGSLVAGFVAERTQGFRWIMMWSAGATLLSGIAAAFSGEVAMSDYTGVAANANRLIRYAVTGK